MDDKTKARFWAKVNKTDSCWIWTGAMSGAGQGIIRINNTGVSARQISWILTNGRSSDTKLTVVCGNPACVNPLHLHPITSSEIGASRGAMTTEEKILAMSSPEPMSGCWIWLGTIGKGGYGKITIGKRADGSRRNTVAHLAAFELYKGKLPEGMEIDHKCRVTCCVNPDHLEAVTHVENMHRSFRARGIW